MDASATAKFNKLQIKLVHLWKMIGQPDKPGSEFQQAENTIVVVPSMSIDTDFKGMEQQTYEERFLFMLFLLRQPNIRMIYITSQPIQASVIDYYLSILPGVVTGNARKRLFLVAPLDATIKPLTAKLLERPRLIEHIKSLIPNPELAHIVPYNTTDLERELSVRLDIPMYAADPTLLRLRDEERRTPDLRGGESTASRGDREPVRRDRPDRRDHKNAQRQAGFEACDGQTQRRRLRRGQRGRGPGRPAIRRPTREALAERVRRCASNTPRPPTNSSSRNSYERGGIVEEFISGRRVPQPQRADARQAARRGAGAVHARSDARRPRRPELPGRQVSG